MPRLCNAVHAVLEGLMFRLVCIIKAQREGWGVCYRCHLKQACYTAPVTATANTDAAIVTADAATVTAAATTISAKITNNATCCHTVHLAKDEVFFCSGWYQKWLYR